MRWPVAPELTRPRLEGARLALILVFATNGWGFASWIARMPAIRDQLQISPSRVGLLLLSLSLGAVGALPLSGSVVHRWGPRASCQVTAVVVAVGIAVVGVITSPPLLVPVLFLIGIATGLWDVAMNVEGAAVERRLGRPLMPHFHAGFSLGTVVGALVGAGAAAADVPVRWHLPAVAVLELVLTTLALRWFLPGRDALEHGDPQPPEAIDLTADPCTGPPTPQPRRSRSRGDAGVLAAWRERRTLAIGLLVLGMAFSEGTANDWLTLGLVDGYRVPHAVAACGYGLFVIAMTAVRLAGPAVLERLGRVTALRGGSVLVAIGAALTVSGSWLREPAGLEVSLAVAAVGVLAWGCGASLGFPIGMSAAADEPSRAPARVSVVSTIGYTAFLAGPPVLGLLGDRWGVLHALSVVLVAVVISLAAAGATRPLERPAA